LVRRFLRAVACMLLLLLLPSHLHSSPSPPSLHRLHHRVTRMQLGANSSERRLHPRQKRCGSVLAQV
jgi:hypothetical protein